MCGRIVIPVLSPGFTEDDRYVVCEIRGYSMNGGDSPRDEATSYWIADTADCYREVATFYSDKRGQSGILRRGRAYELARGMNEEDRAASSAPPT